MCMSVSRRPLKSKLLVGARVAQQLSAMTYDPTKGRNLGGVSSERDAGIWSWSPQPPQTPHAQETKIQLFPDSQYVNCFAPTKPCKHTVLFSGDSIAQDPVRTTLESLPFPSLPFPSLPFHSLPIPALHSCVFRSLLVFERERGKGDAACGSSSSSGGGGGGGGGGGRSRFRHFDSSEGSNRIPAERTAAKFLQMLGETGGCKKTQGGQEVVQRPCAETAAWGRKGLGRMCRVQWCVEHGHVVSAAHLHRAWLVLLACLQKVPPL